MKREKMLLILQNMVEDVSFQLTSFHLTKFGFYRKE